jgi:hypothetical protein
MNAVADGHRFLPELAADEPALFTVARHGKKLLSRHRGCVKNCRHVASDSVPRVALSALQTTKTRSGFPFPSCAATVVVRKTVSFFSPDASGLPRRVD